MKRLLLVPFALPLLAAGDIAITPGKWTTTVEVLDVKLAGAPPAAAQAMKGRPMTTSYCITPEQARRGLRGALRGDDTCRITRFDAAGGRVTSQMTCTRPTGAMTAVSNGTYTPVSYAMTARMIGTGRMAMSMTTRTTGRRVGPC